MLLPQDSHGDPSLLRGGSAAVSAYDTSLYRWNAASAAVKSVQTTCDELFANIPTVKKVVMYYLTFKVCAVIRRVTCGIYNN